MAMQNNTVGLKTKLQAAGLRATRQRIDLARIIFGAGNRHLSAESLHAEAQRAGIRVSLATIYNTLNQFTAAQLLREIVIDPRRSYYDTNTAAHHHFYFEDEGHLEDIPAERLSLQGLPVPPPGTRIDGVDIVIRLTRHLPA
ncbi:MAG TPA: Fur family transcriptional regulator [Nitrococcus sp.]|nr:Fur family transcriptional regulator [Nitrococcus sp.]